ncbi:hypothetical protein [Paenibacillus tundrae]
MEASGGVLRPSALAVDQKVDKAAQLSTARVIKVIRCSKIRCVTVRFK